MYYSNSKLIQHTQPSQHNSQNSLVMGLVRFPRKNNTNNTNNTNVQPPPAPKEPQQDKMTWGEPTWFLFHTLAQKISDQHFSLIRTDLFQLICRICSNLPCPECANHASGYMNGINFDAITTKEQFKLLLWQFHNTVNQRKGFPIYPFENLSKYDNANIGNIYRNFLHVFNQKGYSMRLAAHSFHRSNAVAYIRKWFHKYGHLF
jgi:hypothetical protein